MSDFDFDIAVRNYNSGRLNEEVLWPAVDELTRRNWREISVPGEHNIFSEHDDIFKVRMFAECVNAVCVESEDDDEGRVNKFKFAHINLAKPLGEVALDQRVAALGGESQVAHKVKDLKLYGVWAVNFSNFAPPSVAEGEVLYVDKTFEEIWSGEDIYRSGGSDEGEIPPCGDFGDYEMGMIEIALRVLKVSPKIVQNFKDVRDNPL